jgi:hypothetical protein
VRLRRTVEAEVVFFVAKVHDGVGGTKRKAIGKRGGIA